METLNTLQVAGLVISCMAASIFLAYGLGWALFGRIAGALERIANNLPGKMSRTMPATDEELNDRFAIAEAVGHLADGAALEEEERKAFFAEMGTESKLSRVASEGGLQDRLHAYRLLAVMHELLGATKKSAMYEHCAKLLAQGLDLPPEPAPAAAG